MTEDTRVGLLLSPSETAKRLGCSKDAIAVLAATGHLLQLGDAFPEFTLGPASENRRASLIPGLPAVLTALSLTCDEPLLWALWLSGELTKHRGWCAVDALIAGDSRQVLERARNEDWAWTADE